MLDGILLLSKMAANPLFACILLNVTTSSCQHFPWSYSAEFVFRKGQLIGLKKKKKITFWSRYQLRTYSFKENGAGLKNQIIIILYKIWLSDHFSKVKSYNFHFHTNDVTWPLGANGLFKFTCFRTLCLPNYVAFYTKQDIFAVSFSRPALSMVKYSSVYLLFISYSTICFWIDWIRVYKYTKIKGLDSREITSLPKSKNVMNLVRRFNHRRK